MRVIYEPPEYSPWYNVGQAVGLLAGKLYQNRNRRAAGKEIDNLQAQEMANIIDSNNREYQNALNTYNRQKDNAINELQGAINPYNADQSQANWDRLVSVGKKYDANFDVSDPMAMTNLLNRAKAGDLNIYQDARNRAQQLAQYVNPNVDLTASDWGESSARYGNERACYYRGFKDSNKGKTINGKGDNKYVDFDTYRANDPYNSGFSHMVRPESFTLSNGAPLDDRIFDALTRYYQGGQ